MRAGDEVTFLWRGHVVSGVVTSYNRLIDAAFVRSSEVEEDQIMVWGTDVLLSSDEGIR